MRRKFNVTGVCVPDMHYMVDISGKINKIKDMIENGDYFTINKPRQYGKTTTLYMLSQELKKREDYLAIKMSFEGIGDESYKSEKDFIEELFRQFRNNFILADEQRLLKLLDENNHIHKLGELSNFITKFVVKSGKKVVLLIDEVDQSSNNPLFLNFLGMLRSKYLSRNQGEDNTFQSVILAGVHDVKSLKLKIRPDAEQKYNSPWNIASDFDVDMSFSAEEIETMLKDYSQDKGIEIDTGVISEKLYYYTSGYPFLVSRICKIIDEKLLIVRKQPVWEDEDVDEAVQIVLKETNTNFESLIKNIENNKELYEIVYEIVMKGAERVYNRDNYLLNMGVLYGIFKNENGRLKIHNRIYEQRIYNYMTSHLENSEMSNYNFRDNFIGKDESLDFEKVLLKYQEFMKKEYSERDEAFVEHEGRLLFLAFIKPIINGKGYDFKEVEISEEKRLDIVVTYLNRKYVAELKVWRGQQAHEKGILQLCSYLDRLGLDKGYLVVYDFTKSGRKEWKQDKVFAGGKEIFIVWV